MRSITFISAFYRNPGMLLEQQRIWRAYPDEIKAHFHAIITDDASPKGERARHCVEPTGIASFALYRALKHRRWDWLFCRNLGAEVAQTEWLFLTDIDHVLPDETASFLMHAELDPATAYRFNRVDAPGMTPYKPHPDTWLMTREMFLSRVKGYDERFSGSYGSSSEFRERVIANAKAVVQLPQVIVRYDRSVIPDASTKPEWYGRKEPQDRDRVTRIRAERALIPDWEPLRLTIPYQFEVGYGELRSEGVERPEGEAEGVAFSSEHVALTTVGDN